MNNILNQITKKQIILFLVLLFTFVLLDQIVKYIVVSNMEEYDSIDILPIFSITFIINRGVSFSFLTGLDYKIIFFFSFCAFLLAFILIVQSFRKINFLSIIIMALLAGGSLGNLIDRLYYQGVVDYLHVYYEQYNFPIFNIADCMISCCAVLFLATIFKTDKGRSK